MNTNITTGHRSVLKSLRDLTPNRPLSHIETYERAELQATRLLELSGIQHGPTPTEIVSELPRIRVERHSDLPVSGSAVWDGQHWLIAINSNEYELRQRFSIMHEFKHVIDHPTRHLIRGDKRLGITAHDMAERVADYFAGCVLMPRANVKRAFCNDRIQDVEQLAAFFEVSPKAMHFRLSQLGLSQPLRRCERPTRPYRGRFSGYRRSLPTPALIPVGGSA